MTSPETNKVNLRVKTPESDEHKQWLLAETDRYAKVTAYVSFFVEQRAQMGDMTTEEVFEEFKGNVCLYMRGGFDALGVQ